jgi:hypothetical protein
VKIAGNDCARGVEGDDGVARCFSVCLVFDFQDPFLPNPHGDLRAD